MNTTKDKYYYEKIFHSYLYIIDVKTFSKMLQMFPIGKTTLQKLLNARMLPVVKIGRKYITTQKELKVWFSKYKGKEIKY